MIQVRGRHGYDAIAPRERHRRKQSAKGTSLFRAAAQARLKPVYPSIQHPTSSFRGPVSDNATTWPISGPLVTPAGRSGGATLWCQMSPALSFGTFLRKLRSRLALSSLVLSTYRISWGMMSKNQTQGFSKNFMLALFNCDIKGTEKCPHMIDSGVESTEAVSNLFLVWFDGQSPRIPITWSLAAYLPQ